MRVVLRILAAGVIATLVSLFTTGLPSFAATTPGPGITITPSKVAIDNIGPGITRYAQIMASNTDAVPLIVTVIGSLSPDRVVNTEDILRVTLTGCSVPWSGLPDNPRCDGTVVKQVNGQLPTITLIPNQDTSILISAGLSPQAGNGAMGQTWTAYISVVSQDTAPVSQPVVSAPASPAPSAPSVSALAFTGSNVQSALSLALIAVAIGVVLIRIGAGKRRRKKEEEVH